MDYPGNPNPSYDNNFDHNFDPFEFELSDYLELGDCFGDDPGMQTMASSSSPSQRVVEGVNAHGIFHAAESDADNIDYVNRLKKKKIERGHRVAFRTQSEQEVIDDGYKWRKYGKKTVKSSPNPRNYYRCSFGGCQVKKRVERDREDSSYVITTYEGFHSHDAHPSTTATSNTDYSSPFYYYCYTDHHQHQQLSPDLSALPASNCSNSSSSS